MIWDTMSMILYQAEVPNPARGKLSLPSKKNLNKTTLAHSTQARHRILQNWARDWRALALTQVHHWSRKEQWGKGSQGFEVFSVVFIVRCSLTIH